MPYSTKKLLEKEVKKYAKKAKENFVETAIEAKHKTFKELYRETSFIFDRCIDQYYRYETTSYYRHETGKGSGTGVNLYRANQMQHIQNGIRDMLVLGWDGSDVAAYKSKINPDYVMDNVANGIRGVEDAYMKYAYKPYDNHWSAIVESKYFGTLEGTMNNIFDEIERQWNDVSGNLFTEHFLSLYNNRKR